MNHMHRPFADGKFKGVWDSLRNSPYPLHYTLRWPWYFHYPSVKKHSLLPAQPDTYGQITSPATKLLFAGDIMVLNGDQPPRLSSELCQLIRSSDLFIANLEAPLGTHQPNPEKKYTFRFHMPQAFLTDIQQQIGLPFSRWLLTNANNHSGDMGATGFDCSLQLLQELGVHVVGHRAVTNPALTLPVNDVQLGFSGWTHWLNRDVEHKQQPIIRAQDLQQTNLTRLKEHADIDFLIGLPHWEYEFQHYPRARTRQHAQQFIHAGFDLLVGSHPHVLQPYEWIANKPCFYSLGNFCGLGIAWPVKIIVLLEVHLVKHLSQTRISYFKHHYFYQYHQANQIDIVPLNTIPTTLHLRADMRLAQLRQPCLY